VKQQARVQMSLFNLKKFPFVVDTEYPLWNRCLPDSPFLNITSNFEVAICPTASEDVGRKKGEWGVFIT
jgi:hypothetical protein